MPVLGFGEDENPPSSTTSKKVENDDEEKPTSSTKTSEKPSNTPKPTTKEKDEEDEEEETSTTSKPKPTTSTKSKDDEEDAEKETSTRKKEVESTASTSTREHASKTSVALDGENTSLSQGVIDTAEICSGKGIHDEQCLSAWDKYGGVIIFCIILVLLVIGFGLYRWRKGGTRKGRKQVVRANGGVIV